MHAVKGSIPLNQYAANLEEIRGRAKAMIEPVVKALDDRFIIPDDKIDRVIDYTVEFFAKNHKTMKPDRMIRKISEYFHLKPKPNESDSVQGDQPDAGQGSAAV